VFVSHTSEFAEYPVGRSYVAAVAAAVSACGHVVVEMEGSPARDQTPAALCEKAVRAADVYVGVFGLCYGSPVRDRPEVSYTALEFECATNARIARLAFVLDEQSTEIGIPPGRLFDADVARQQAFVNAVKNSGVTTAPFRNVDDLARRVERSLRDLEALQREQARDLPGAGAPALSTAPLTVPHQLPGGTRGFVGRVADLQVLTRLLDETQADEAADGIPIAAVFGGAGIGKTTLALNWAHRVAERFPDGQLYVNLRGFDAVDAPMEPAAAVRGFLGAFGLNSERIPQSFEEQVALYRTLLWDRWVLVVLDNARDEAQLHPLLPGKGFVLVTSRNTLRGLLADGAQPIALDLLSEQEATELFTRYLGADRVAAEPDAIQDLVNLTSRLPLAVAVVGSRARISESISLAALVAQLRDEPDLLDALEAGDMSVSVQSVFSWSYRGFTPDAARLFRLTGLHAGPDISGDAAAALLGTSPRVVQPLLGELTRAHFLQEFRPGRYRSHDLLQAYATKLAGIEDSDEQRHAALLRVFDYYLHTAFSADQQLYPYRHPIALSPPDPAVVPRTFADGEEAWGWFTEEIATLLAVTAYAAAHGYLTHAWQLPWTFATFLHRQGGWHDYAASQELALTAAEMTKDPVAIARVERNIGRPYTLLGLVDEAVSHYERALALCRDIGDPTGEALCEDALAWQYGRIGRHADAITHAERALSLWGAADDKAGRARSLNYIGWNRARLERYADALEPCTEALRLFREISNEVGEADTLDSLGYAYQYLGDHARAVDFYRQSSALWHRLGDRYNEADVLNRLGDVHRDAGELDAAARAWNEAVTILVELSHPEAAAVRAKLDAIAKVGERPVV
jgi:tetratricopeptide (TPR) repeat protein